jgi:hypothetical protein
VSGAPPGRRPRVDGIRRTIFERLYPIGLGAPRLHKTLQKLPRAFRRGARSVGINLRGDFIVDRAAESLGTGWAADGSCGFGADAGARLLALDAKLPLPAVPDDESRRQILRVQDDERPS